MGKVNKKALTISLIVTLLCALVLFNYIRNLKVPTTEKAKTTILVSVRNISPGEQIFAADVRSIDVSSDSVPEGIVFDQTLIEGLYAKEAILIGEPFREQRLVPKENLSLAYRLPKGTRAVSIFVNEANLLAMQLIPGNKVDVIASWNLQTKEGVDVPVSQTVLQNVEVLALGPNLTPDDKAGLPNRGTYSIDDIPKTVTLAVTLQEAETLTYNTENSNLTIALRGQGDDEDVVTNGAMVIDQLTSRLSAIALEPGKAKADTGTTNTVPVSGGSTVNDVP